MTDVRELDAASPDEAADLLRASCSSRAWLDAMVRTRPHRTLAALTEASDAALAELSWDDIEEALAAHPRIGTRLSGADREATWSREEQSSATTTDQTVADELFAANVAYDDRFGHVFLICATGRSAAQILAEARRRLGNDVDTERTEVRRELRDIVRLRLAKTFESVQVTARDPEREVLEQFLAAMRLPPFGATNRGMAEVAKRLRLIAEERVAHCAPADVVNVFDAIARMGTVLEHGANSVTVLAPCGWLRMHRAVLTARHRASGPGAAEIHLRAAALEGKISQRSAARLLDAVGRLIGPYLTDAPRPAG